MFIAGRMFATAEEAKAWVEATVPVVDDRRHWMVLQLEGEEPREKPVIQGLNDGSILVEKKKPE